jgi:hypothetical protein
MSERELGQAPKLRDSTIPIVHLTWMALKLTRLARLPLGQHAAIRATKGTGAASLLGLLGYRNTPTLNRIVTVLAYDLFIFANITVD